MHHITCCQPSVRVVERWLTYHTKHFQLSMLDASLQCGGCYCLNEATSTSLVANNAIYVICFLSQKITIIFVVEILIHKRQGCAGGVVEEWRSLCIHTNMHACIHTYTHTPMHSCTHTYTHADIHTCKCAYMLTNMHTYIHTYINIHTYMHTYIYANTYIHALIHTYIHTHIHTYTHANMHAWMYAYIHSMHACKK